MSVQVAVRIRPFNQSEIEMRSVLCVQMENNKTILENIENLTNPTREFVFDYSFWSHDQFTQDENGITIPINDKYSDQQKVYDTIGKDTLQNLIDGYHCCVFAYGQTSSGKSYSMFGYEPNLEIIRIQQLGLVPMMSNNLFEKIQNKDEETSYEIFFSMIEIYNEKIQDLLVDTNRRTIQGLKIREHKNLGVYVEGLQKVPVTSYEEIKQKINYGNRNRHIASTQMNATSSRGHTIVQIEFRQTKNSLQKLSIMNLVDLAGSEKISKTQATGDRMKEGCMINKSLSVLGQVISNLAEKAIKKNNTITPYRDSVLTRILQNALGGNSKTVMICTISPSYYNYEETLSTLRYADQAKKIKCNAVINESDQDKLVRELMAENQLLKEKMQDLENQRFTCSKFNDQDINILNEELNGNKFLISQFEQKFNKLKHKNSQSQFASEQSSQTFYPYLINLNEDAFLNGLANHYFQKEITTGLNLYIQVGRKNDQNTPDITLGNPGIKNDHAVFKVIDEIVYLEPVDKKFYYFQQSCQNIYVNGLKIQKYIKLNNMDRIIFGTNTTFLMCYQENIQFQNLEYDWEFAQSEKKKKNRSTTILDDVFQNQVNERSQVKRYTQINSNLLKGMQNRASIDLARKIEQEKNEAKIEKINSLLIEVNLIAKELNKQVLLIAETPYFYQNDIINKNDKLQIKVLNRQYEDIYYWSLQKFMNRYYIIKDIYYYYRESKILKIIKKENDPFWDPTEKIIQGVGYYSMISCAYHLSIEQSVQFVGINGIIGKLDIKVGPCGDDNEFRPLVQFTKDPRSLLYSYSKFKVEIMNIEIPDLTIYDMEIQYSWFQDEFQQTQVQKKLVKQFKKRQKIIQIIFIYLNISKQIKNQQMNLLIINQDFIYQQIKINNKKLMKQNIILNWIFMNFMIFQNQLLNFRVKSNKLFVKEKINQLFLKKDMDSILKNKSLFNLIRILNKVRQKRRNQSTITEKKTKDGQCYIQ